MIQGKVGAQTPVSPSASIKSRWPK